jgi:hypothetical protein
MRPSMTTSVQESKEYVEESKEYVQEFPRGPSNQSEDGAVNEPEAQDPRETTMSVVSFDATLPDASVFLLSYVRSMTPRSV